MIGQCEGSNHGSILMRCGQFSLYAKSSVLMLDKVLWLGGWETQCDRDGCLCSGLERSTRDSVSVRPAAIQGSRDLRECKNHHAQRSA